MYKNIFDYSGVDCKLKRSKITFISVFMTALIGSRLVSYAHSTDVNRLKSGILLNERYNYQYNIYDYNTNDDDIVNVFDFCRYKKDMLRNEAVPMQKITFSFSEPEVDNERKHMRIPVFMDGNTTGLSSVNMHLNYDSTKLSLVSISVGDFEGYGYIGGNGDNIVFNTFNSCDISEKSGTLMYLELDINDNTVSQTLSFELTDIKAYYSENWNSVQISGDKCSDRSDTFVYTFDGADITVSETTVTDYSLVTTTEEITELPVTAVTEPPVTNPPETSTDTDNNSLEDVERDFVRLLNEYRAENGVSELSFDNLMCRAAEIRAYELVKDFDSNRDPDSVFDEVGVRVLTYSFLETATQETAEAALRTAKSSANESILKSSHNRIGLAHVYDSSSRYKHYWVVYLGN